MSNPSISKIEQPLLVNETESSTADESKANVESTKSSSSENVSQLNDNNKELSADALKENEKSADRVIFNPTVTEEHEELLGIIRQNAIGDTMYSEYYVLDILVKTTKVEKKLKEFPELERKLCNLWDMTTEPQVVKFLLNHHVLDIFTKVIETVEDNRMEEIIIGIIANLLYDSEARTKLTTKPRTMQLLIALLNSSDSLTLIQIMRVFSMSFTGTDSKMTLKWCKEICSAPHFVQSFMFILNNSLNKNLLSGSLEALNAILAKFALLESEEDEEDLPTFEEFFLKEELPESLIAAFDTLLPTPTDEAAAVVINEDNDISEHVKKTVQLFLNIHSILLQYGEFSRLCYASLETDLIKCSRYILEPLTDPLTLTPLYTFELNVIEGVSTIFEAFGDPFDEITASHMFTIWINVVNHIEAIKNNKSKPAANDFETDDDDADAKDVDETGKAGVEIHDYILDFLAHTILNANAENLHKMLLRHTPKNVAQLLLAFGTSENLTNIRKECCRKIKETLKG